MDILKFIYNNLIIGLPFSNYEKYKSGELSKQTQEEKIKEIKNEHLQSFKDKLVSLIIEQKSEILTPEERELLYYCKKKRTLYSSILFSSLFGILSFYIYNLLIKKKFYNKTLFFGNVFGLLTYGYFGGKLKQIKDEQIISKYKDLISLEDAKRFSEQYSSDKSSDKTSESNQSKI